MKPLFENPSLVKENQTKRFGDESVVDKLINIHNEYVSLNDSLKDLKVLKNQITSSFLKAPKEKTIDVTQSDDLLKEMQEKIKLLTEEQLRESARFIGSKIDTYTHRQSIIDEEKGKLMDSLGNMLHADVPISNNEDNNQIIYETGTQVKKAYDHSELGYMLNIVDNENGQDIAGNRGYFLRNYGVRLAQALINYSCDFLSDRNYELMYTPLMVNKDVMSKITQLSDYEETLYKIENEDKYLIATSEQPLTGYFYSKMLNKASLPIKFGGVSECFRKETGRHGKQTSGIYRVHQFQKIEQFCITEPDKSWEMFHEMINTSKAFYDSLGISYRVVSIVSGALNNAASMKYDLEGWFPGTNSYGELVSCTNCLDYFSKRLNTRIKDPKDTKNKPFAHMLNSTLCANTRVLCCLMETYQTNDGMIVPDVLQKYMGGVKFIPFINKKNILV